MKNTSYIFDLDDTLYLKTDPFVRAVREIFPACKVDPYELYEAFKRRGNESFEPSMRGEITVEEMYIYRISKALADHGEACTDAQALDFQRQYNFCQKHLVPSPLMLEIIRKCNEGGAFTGIITNGLSDHQREKFYALGLDRLIPEDHLIVSEDTGTNKPDPEIMRYAEKKWKLDPASTVYIGDSYCHDIVCAKKAGWKAVLLVRGESLAPDARAAHKAACIAQLAADAKTDPALQPDLIAADYNELLEALQSSTAAVGCI